MGAGNTSRKDTIEMVTYFKNHHRRRMVGQGPVDNEPTNVADSAWFNLEEVFKFLNGIQGQGATGVRMYFGAHCHKEKDGDIYGYNNVILVGTTGHGKNTDIPVPANEFTDESYALSTKPKVDGGDDDMNNGHLCPPHCDGGETI